MLCLFSLASFIVVLSGGLHTNPAPVNTHSRMFHCNTRGLLKLICMITAALTIDVLFSETLLSEVYSELLFPGLNKFLVLDVNL